MAASIEEQVSIYLTDLHAIEVQALEQVKRAVKVAGDPEIGAAFARHVRETERHRLYVEDRLLAKAWAPASPKDTTGKLTGVAMALFARFQPDTPGKLVVHGYSYERMELAAYELLIALAERAGDRETARTARMIQEDERAMAERLEDCFDRAVEASLRRVDAGELDRQLNKYLADAHAIEVQAARLLTAAPGLADVAQLAHAFEEHLEATERHIKLIEGRLHARGASRSATKDIALKLGALHLGVLLKAQPDTPAKLAAFAYAFEHLEIAAYELLRRVAVRAGDDETAVTAHRILADERGAAARILGLLGTALQASLQQSGLAA